MSTTYLFKVFIFLFLLENVSGIDFSSVYHLERSRMTAVQFVELIDKIILDREKPKSNLEQIKTEHLVSKEKTEVLKGISTKLRTTISAELNRHKPVPTNPVSVYLYVKAVCEAMSALTELCKETKNNDYLQVIEYFYVPALPNEIDLIATIMSFVRIQNTYNMTASDLASGNIFGFQFETLSVQDCFDIGKVILERGYPRIAKQWFQTALEKTKSKEDACRIKTSTCSDLHSMVEKSFEMERLYRTNFDKDIINHSGTGLSENVEDEITELKILRESNSISYYGVEISRNLQEYRNYEKLCRKGNVRVHGYCRYASIQEIYFYQQPIKIEIISYSPRIVMVHDIVDSNVIKILEGYNILLKGSTVITKSNDTIQNLVSESRTSASYNLKHDTTEPLILKYYGLLERLTGLRMNEEQSEHLHVVNYGIGGEFRPHFDWIKEELVDAAFHTKTNRLLTIISYLSDVEVGGSTVFPRLGISISPVKGSALFFPNLDNQGHGNPLTLHAGCPVLVGSKTIANKWVHMKNQDTNFLKTHPSIW